MMTNLQQREVFHLIFLRHLARLIKPNSYALKGGCNLRFFYRSPRYSEDMDIDIKDIEVFRLKEIVMDILGSKAFIIALRLFGIEDVIPPKIGRAKQTETVQRFKVHILTSASQDLFTKIEFSRRKIDTDARAESVAQPVLFAYKQPPLIISHYPAGIAIKQKLEALALRTEPQARDVFDIFMLLTQLQKADLERIKKMLAVKNLRSAEKSLFSLKYEDFKNTVCGFLDGEERGYYETPKMWEDIQLKVAEVISNGGQV